MKPIGCVVNPHVDPEIVRPDYYVSRADAESRVNQLGVCYWVNDRLIHYVSREQRNREEMIAAGTFREAWKQIPSGPTRIPVWQMPTSERR